jgi:hypothetical protein
MSQLRRRVVHLGLDHVLIKGRCNNFLLHGPTFEETTAAPLTGFLDCAGVDLGLLCNPGKLTPPLSHLVKYTGLIFHSTTKPILRAPEYKVDKAIAMVDYVLAQHKQILHLSLAVLLASEKESTCSPYVITCA